jgi:DNA-binding transcriptional regulator YiaG
VRRRILSPDRALQLRADVALRATLSNKALARKYGVSTQTVTYYAHERHKPIPTHHENGDGV